MGSEEREGAKKDKGREKREDRGKTEDHLECGVLCLVGDGSLCLGGDYW